MGERRDQPDTVEVLDRLVAVIDETIALQPAIDAVIAICVADSPKDAALAQRGRALGAALGRGLRRVDALPNSPVVEEVRNLLRYHQRMLDEALLFGYRGHGYHHQLAAPYYSASLGEPAARLRRLRFLIRGEALPSP